MKIEPIKIPKKNPPPFKVVRRIGGYNTFVPLFLKGVKIFDFRGIFKHPIPLLAKATPSFQNCPCGDVWNLKHRKALINQSITQKLNNSPPNIGLGSHSRGADEVSGVVIAICHPDWARRRACRRVQKNQYPSLKKRSVSFANGVGRYFFWAFLPPFLYCFSCRISKNVKKISLQIID